MTQSLLQRIAAGDRDAVQACINQYGGLVWSLARRLSHTQADAEEGVQEVFISLWENAGRFDETVASETTFVAMIARRRLIDRQRKQRRRIDAAPLPEFAGPVELESAFSAHESGDAAAHALKAMKTLRPEQQQVLQLSIMHGRTYEQIAEATGMPVGTVKTHARRGLIRLREMLAGDLEDDTSVEARS